MKLLLKMFLIMVLVPIILLDWFLFVDITSHCINGGWPSVRHKITYLMFDEEEYVHTHGDDRLRYVAKTVAEGYERSFLFVVALIVIHYVIIKGLQISGRKAARNIPRIGAGCSESNETKWCHS